MTKAGGSQFRKDVQFAETKDSDEYALEASGIVMVPDKADLQNDFAREETIREFAEQFGTFVEAGQAGGGIMHAVFPDGWMALERNEVLDEAEEIGGQTVEPGAWVQRWGINNEQLAALVEDGILEGYSIGAIQVDWNGPYEQDGVDDVDTSEIPDGEVIYELVDGIIREVSQVDIPAVPDAEILEAKGLDKRLADHVGNPDAFIEEAMERGHTESEAEQLWDVLNAAVGAEGSSEPGKQSVFARAGKAFLSALSGDDEPDTNTADKEGQTLSAPNQESAMAAIDANLDMLEDAGVDHGMTRFTDQEDVDFDLSEHDARNWSGDCDGEGDEDHPFDPEASASKDATGGDTPDADDTNDTTDMSDDDPGEGKSLAEQNAEQINELTDAVKTLTETVESDGPADSEKTAEIELPDGTVAEVSKAEALAWFDGEENTGEKDVQTPATKEDIEALHTRLDSIVREGGHSQQLDQGGNGDEGSGLDDIGKALS